MIGAPVVLIVAIMGVVLLASLIPNWMAFLSFPAMLILVGGILATINMRLQQPRSQEDRILLQQFEQRRNLRSAYHRKTLDQRAARLLDACAYHRNRILSVIDSPGWTGGSRDAVRAQTLGAVDGAMSEAIAYSTPYVGTGQVGGPWKELAQDVAEGQLGGALKKLQTMLQTDANGHIIDRSKLPVDLWPVYDIAVKLQKLASEVEALNRNSEPVTSAQSNLDQLLHNLSSQRAAEDELNQELRQGL